MTFPREGKFTSSHFFASKDVMGIIGKEEKPPTPTLSAFLGEIQKPDLPFVAFLDFLALFVARNFLAFLSVFPFFPRS